MKHIFFIIILTLALLMISNIKVKASWSTTFLKKQEKEVHDLSENKYTFDSVHLVNGNQGVACENEEYYVCNSDTIFHYDKDWKMVSYYKSKFLNCFEGLKISALGDIEVYNGEVYRGVEFSISGHLVGIYIAIYDTKTLRLKKFIRLKNNYTKIDSFGITVDKEKNNIWILMCRDDSEDKNLFRYNLDTWEYKEKYYLKYLPQNIKGIAYDDGYIYISSDDGNYDEGKADHLYVCKVELNKKLFDVTLEKSFDSQKFQGEIGGLSIDRLNKKIIVCYNRKLPKRLKQLEFDNNSYKRVQFEAYTYRINKNDYNSITSPNNDFDGLFENEKISISDKFDLLRYMDLEKDQFVVNSIQGSAVSGDYLFTAINTMKYIAVHDLKTKTFVGKITFNPIDTYHCNTISFSNIKKNPEDEFPLLYVSMENEVERKTVVLQISRCESDWIANQIQEIFFPPIEQMPIYYPNCVVDAQNNILYVTGYTMNTYLAQSGNKIKVLKFDLPSIQKLKVNLTDVDVISTFEYEAFSCTQGMIIRDNILYQCYGADWTNDKKIYVGSINLEYQNIDTKILMNEYGYTTEPEALFIYNDKLFMVDVSGSVLEFVFY